MNRRIRFFTFLLLFLLQLLINRLGQDFKYAIDLTYLILFLVAIRSPFISTIISASLIGLLIDYFSAGIIGVFGFARTVSGFVLHSMARFLDLRRNGFIFLLILITLFVSNLIANFFFLLIFDLDLTLRLLVVQPISTAIVAVIVLASKKAKMALNVY